MAWLLHGVLNRKNQADALKGEDRHSEEHRQLAEVERHQALTGAARADLLEAAVKHPGDAGHEHNVGHEHGHREHLQGLQPGERHQESQHAHAQLGLGGAGCLPRLQAHHVPHVLHDEDQVSDGKPILCQHEAVIHDLLGPRPTNLLPQSAERQRFDTQCRTHIQEECHAVMRQAGHEDEDEGTENITALRGGERQREDAHANKRLQRRDVGTRV
mmetsp:Transcript_16903/g.44702  ORF Transcript_16903/g.44702 Transcript_16903/m.44702 type:complete len:215 (-) Transcript_16903:434-1078(-)